MLDLSIVILSYKSKEHLKVLLPSLFGSRTKYRYEVIVVDNGSNDGTAKWVEEQIHLCLTHGRELNKDLKLIKNVNNGFATGNNVGIRQSSGRYVLLLNPDTKLEPDTLETMLDFMESRPDVGIAGPKIIKGDGRLDLACRRRFPNPWNG